MIGIARAAAEAGLPVTISFTTETDGRLPDGTSLAAAGDAVDAATGGSPMYYGINCAHPVHFATALPGGATGARIRSVRANASRKSHTELDESPDLDTGDPVQLARDYLGLRAQHPQITIVGGRAVPYCYPVAARPGYGVASFAGWPARTGAVPRQPSRP